MKAAKIVAIILACALAINFARSGADFPLPQVLPFCSAYRPSFYDFGAVILIVLCLRGLSRLKRQGEERGAAEDTVYEIDGSAQEMIAPDGKGDSEEESQEDGE